MKRIEHCLRRIKKREKAIKIKSGDLVKIKGFTKWIEYYYNSPDLIGKTRAIQGRLAGYELCAITGVAIKKNCPNRLKGYNDYCYWVCLFDKQLYYVAAIDLELLKLPVKESKLKK